MTDTRRLEGDIGPHFRNAIRELRKRYKTVEPYAYDPGELVVLVTVENEEGETHTRRLTIDGNNTVYEQDRRKINGHFGPNLRVDREPGDPGVLHEQEVSTLPKSAFRRQTVRRLRSRPDERQHFPQSLASKRLKLQALLATSEREFQRNPDRSSLLTLQAARIALNAIDEQIVRTQEAGE